MGTSGAYGGSGGGAWSRARASARRVRDQPSEQTIADLVRDTAVAAGWGPSDLPDPAPVASDRLDAPARPASVFRIPDGVLARGLAGLGAATAGARAGQGGGDGGSGHSGLRPLGRVARTASRVIGSGYAVQHGDAARLAELGLGLAELRGLDPFDQSLQILEVLAGGSSIQDEELHRALADVLVSIQTSAGTVPPEDVVRAFVVGYTFQVICTENGAVLREADDPAELERQIREYLEVRVRDRAVVNLDGDGSTVSVESLEQATRSLMSEATEVFGSP